MNNQDQLNQLMTDFAAIRQRIIDTPGASTFEPLITEQLDFQRQNRSPIQNYDPNGPRRRQANENDPDWQAYLEMRRKENELDPNYGILRRRIDAAILQQPVQCQVEADGDMVWA